ncbi:hypothetical protein SAMN06265338_1085 [Rhodoblastus acidophilus]|uniref:Uncharacterized protein n=1 Tax=Rhodoblastus acidophilus TaxID=1074 RepID=A0A212RVU5_RHOAC|nr:hypothetical protein [Rhodoblastus acidophilus]MCW2315128.1 hypothetical protein [Rhodoblastus acidophilus]PPQ35538.1 hypothetical protein CKO16_20450 [Rhodoblastus acidophilus]RAI18853.1 hypothetical protein CH337_13085 [Rhodoblastus acidophilus]SNB76705.1 hypothetical protein SAMN06265338_1085 [Rhodoblastus acidophilus]
MASQQDQDDLLDALFEMAQSPGKRPSIVEAQLKYLPEWDNKRLREAAEGLLANGDILNPSHGAFNVDLSSAARKKAAARVSGSAGASSTTYNIGSVHHSPFQHVAPGGYGVQNTNYQMTANDLRAIVDLYWDHVDELKLDVATRRKADAQIRTIEAQLIDEPDPTIVKAAGKSLKTIVEGAIGGALGNALANPGVWAPLLALFS